MDGGGEEGPHANNGMQTMHQIAVVDDALDLALLLAGCLCSFSCVFAGIPHYVLISDEDEL